MADYINVKGFGRFYHNKIETFSPAYNSKFANLYIHYVELACEIKHIHFLASHLRYKCENNKLTKQDDELIRF